MTTVRIAVLQMCSSIDPIANAATVTSAIGQAAAGGAAMLFTPEMTGLIDRDRVRARGNVRDEAHDVVLQATRDAARRHGVSVSLGSLAIADAGVERLANRSFVVGADGEVRARYDKLHLFDADPREGEAWRESNGYRAGERATVVATPVGTLGLSICYDLRFPALYQALSDAGATIFAVPSAFTVPTGRAHWHVLLRARAIENAAFVVAAAQSGKHADGRETFGHAIVVDPWGKVLLDMGQDEGLGICDLDLVEVTEARRRLPVLTHRRDIPSIEQVA